MRIKLSRAVVAAVLLACQPGAAISSLHPGADDRIAQRGPSLKDELEKGLKARRPEEFLFVERVVALVNEGRLPLKLVRSTFVWARRKKPYPFPYFQRAMVQRAAQIGVIID